MFYVIQENTFKERHFDLLLETLNRYGIGHEVVKYIPFHYDIFEWYDSALHADDPDFKPTRYNTTETKVFCFGADGLAKAAKLRGWVPGSMLNSNHDYNVYGPAFGFENMLNGDGYVINFGDPIPFDDESFFVRPTLDTKSFSGQIFTREAWNDYTQLTEDTNCLQVLTDETQVLVSTLKNIQQEVRCWVVDGKVVTASRYKIGDRVQYLNYDHESFYVDFAQRMVDKFQVADAFVIDVCLADDQLKVVEVNSINAAGFYDCNIEKLITALEEKFN